MRIPLTREQPQFLYEVTKRVKYGEDGLSKYHIQRMALSAFTDRWNQLERNRSDYPGTTARNMTFVHSWEINEAVEVLNQGKKKPNDAHAYRKIFGVLNQLNRHEFRRQQVIGSAVMSDVVPLGDGKYETIQLTHRDFSSPDVEGLRTERQAYLEHIGSYIGSSEFAAKAIEDSGPIPTLLLGRIPGILCNSVEESGIVSNLAAQAGLSPDQTLTTWLSAALSSDLHRHLKNPEASQLDDLIISETLTYLEVPVQ
jgi:hypothetical protein